MRVGLVCPYDLSTPGGVQAQVLGLAVELNAAGDDVLVVGPNLPPEIQGIDLGGSTVIPGNGSRAPLALDPRVGRRLRAGVAEVDALHVHEPLMPLASLAALRAGKPVVATFHAAPGEIGRRMYNLIGDGLSRVLGSNVRSVTAVSRTARSVLPDGLDVEIVPNGVDTAAFRLEATKQPHSVCFLGRDEPRKGLDVLMAAWPEVLQKVPGATLHVIGAERPTPGVIWHGHVDEAEKARLLAASQICVAPHTGGESFGIALVEAMAAGTALLASDLGAFVDVAGGAATFFPAADPNALADELVTMLHDAGRLEDASTAGRKRAGDYDWDNVSGRYRAMYERALS